MLGCVSGWLTGVINLEGSARFAPNFGHGNIFIKITLSSKKLHLKSWTLKILDLVRILTIFGTSSTNGYNFEKKKNIKIQEVKRALSLALAELFTPSNTMFLKK